MSLLLETSCMQLKLFVVSYHQIFDELDGWLDQVDESVVGEKFSEIQLLRCREFEELGQGKQIYMRIFTGLCVAKREL